MRELNMKNWLKGACAVALTVAWGGALAAPVAGKILAVKGEVTAAESAGSRVLERDAQVFVTDRIDTGDKSYAVIEFIDGGKATIRPKSTLVIEKYAYESGAADGALLNLVKGGLRAVTGGIAKARPESYQVQAGVATLGVRGTEFVIRMCENDCAEEEKMYTEGLSPLTSR